MMNERRRSDGPIVPGKLPNKERARTGFAEEVEGRGPAKGNSGRRNMSRAQDREIVQKALDRIREAAENDRELRFTSLWHHVYNLSTLREAFYHLKRKSAPGVDGETWLEYEADLEANLQALSQKLKEGGYRANLVKRVYIPKPDGRQRPIGILTLEDKIVQRSATQVLSAVYETDFLGFSYGFRPGRSMHNAMDALLAALEIRKVNWVLDADISGFFDAINHDGLLEMIERRIADERVRRHVTKWLKAGVLDDGSILPTDVGTPQGGGISPLLANIYLHYAFDVWAHRWRKTKARGEVIMVRYADDFVVGFQYRQDAETFLADLKSRLDMFYLKINEDKTRLVEFGRFAAVNRKERGEGRPETFDFLGFTFYCSKTRKGKFAVKRRTVKKRLRKKLKEVKAALRLRMHAPVPEVGKWLGSVVQGYYNYHAVPFNYRTVSTFYQEVVRFWKQSLGRRSQKGGVTWERMRRLADRYIPRPRILVPYHDRSRYR